MITITLPGGSSDDRGRQIVVANLAVSGIVLILMMLLGVLMRFAQGGWLDLPPDRFYQFLTLHGTGMVAVAMLGGISVMWFFLNRHIRLSTAILTANLIIFIVGVAIILAADLIGGFAGAWTVLYPLPALSAGLWEAGAAFSHLFGLLLVGIGFLLVCLDFARALISRYGGLAAAHGWPQLFGLSKKELPPPTIVASTMATIVTTLALVAAAIIIVLMMINLVVPQFTIDPLFAKNVIYFFGHTIINATIYMAVIAVYELLPRYTGREWKSSRVFVAAWTGSTIMVLVIFPHHLMMDFAMPQWAVIMAQILSYTNSFPVLIVTGFGAIMIVHRSGIRWDVVSGLLFLSMFGWMAGVVPAVVDATIVVNSVMHNTLWVPGHFHFYLLLGLIPMILAFMYYLINTEAVRTDRWTVLAYLVSGLGFVVMFLYSGRQSVPRRWAEHVPEWMLYDRIASVFASIVLLVTIFLVIRFLAGLSHQVRTND